MSSVGLIVMAVVVGLGLLIEWFQDWRMLRTLRRHLAKMRARRNLSSDMDTRSRKEK